MKKKWTILIIIFALALAGWGINQLATKTYLNDKHIKVQASPPKNDLKQKTGQKITRASLHQSNMEAPNKSALMDMQTSLYGQIAKKDLASVIKCIHEMHMMFECGFIFENGNWIDRLSDPQSPSWMYWEKTGPIQLPGETEIVYNLYSH